MAKNAEDLIADIGLDKLERLKSQLVYERARAEGYRKSLEKAQKIWSSTYIPKQPIAKKRGADRYYIRIIIPDTHGMHIDIAARDAFLRDLSSVGHLVREVVILGDLMDCGGTFSQFQKLSSSEFTESYANDIAATNDFLDRVHKLVPHAKCYYVEGNHEYHIHRWAARTFDNLDDAQLAINALGPVAVLHLKKRGVEYFSLFEHYHGLSVPGIIRLGKCFFMHGYSSGRHADYAHLLDTGDNVVFGHVHRTQGTVKRTVTQKGIGAWCPGCLCKLQRYFHHTRVSSWTHGYGIQFVNAKTGEFTHHNASILGGESAFSGVIAGLLERNKP